jgi:hypothetical protein
MSMHRRGLLTHTLGFTSTLIAVRAAAAAESAGLAPLRAAGLDPFETYLRVFASLEQGAECAWWFMGALPRDIEDVGPVETIQEETVRIHRTEVVGPGQIDFRWREVGVFRDIMTGENPGERFDPVTGTAQKAGRLLGGGAGARVSVRKVSDGLTVSLALPRSKVGEITVKGEIAGNRVCLTHLEDKTRETDAGAPAAPTNRTAFKHYADLDELKKGAPSVQADGFYGVKNRDTNRVFVNGLMRKARMDEAVNPIAWERLKKDHPSFFKGDRLAPSWDA